MQQVKNNQQTDETEEPLGHRLLESRIERCASIIESLIELPVRPRLPHIPQHFVITGIGSSEAHARFFVNLINEYSTATAHFAPISSFLNSAKIEYKQSTLVVISQGICPNAMLPLNQSHEFEHTVLFTAVTETGAIESGSKDKIRILKKLYAENQTIINFPIEHEDNLLLRVIGPIAGYLAIIQFINLHWPDAIPSCPYKDLLNAIHQAKEKVPPSLIEEFPKDIKSGSILLAQSPLSQYIHNLSSKFIEGLFVSQPHIIDYLSFAHGPFQQWTVNPIPVIIFDSGTSTENILYEQITPLLKVTESSVWRIISDLPPPWSILEFEAIINQFILQVIKNTNINLRNWPGKDQDKSLYNIQDPIY